MTEREIENLLADRHAKDVFIPQCKDGPTTGGLSIMDGWAMNRSWSRLTFWGYEIKVSKQDFIHDEKWHTYLPYCNQLYFVCPKGVISVESVPDGVGLIYALPRYLKIVKKAAHREVVIPQNFWCYVLMCRSEIVASTFGAAGAPDKRERLRQWLAEKEEDRKLGYEVGRSVRYIVDKAKSEAEKYKTEAWKAQEVLRTCETLGINLNSWSPAEQLSRQARELSSHFNEQSLLALRQAHSSLSMILEDLKKAGA
jgi:hypothetical protein